MEVTAEVGGFLQGWAKLKARTLNGVPGNVAGIRSVYNRFPTSILAAPNRPISAILRKHPFRLPLDVATMLGEVVPVLQWLPDLYRISR